MTRRVKDYIDIGDHTSLDGLIGKLVELRDSLPQDGEAELRVRGDEVFGRRLSISFFRPLTAEEEACEDRYVRATRESMERELMSLQEELSRGATSRPPRRRGGLRAVA